MKQLFAIFAIFAVATSATAGVVLEYNTIPDLLTINPMGINRVAVAKGHTTPGDNLGGIFYYDPASTTATNTTTVFKPNGYAGRWLRLVLPASASVPALTILTTNTVLTAGDTGTTYSNHGATNTITVTLPPAAAALQFRFLCASTNIFRIAATNSATIRVTSTETAANGTIESITLGDDADLFGLTSTNWHFRPVLGQWLFGP